VKRGNRGNYIPGSPIIVELCQPVQWEAQDALQM